MAVAPAPVEKMKIDVTNIDVPEDAEQRMRFFTSMSPAMIDEFFEKREEISNKRAQFLAEEGVLARAAGRSAGAGWNGFRRIRRRA